ncbi:MAG: hypothetical protein R2838_01095 [Caldilineaceae bacterium]
MTMPRMPVKLDPGQRTGFTLTVPRRAAVSTAGRHEMLLIVQSRISERQAQLPCCLAIAPFDDPRVLSDLQPRRLHATWAQHDQGVLASAIWATGRREIRLVGQCADVPCLFTFAEGSAVHHESLC